MANIKSGEDRPCEICGEMYYRSKHFEIRGTKRTCGKSECRTSIMSGENNPFWGKKHDEESRAKIRAGRSANPPKGTGPPKGWKRPPEDREKMRVRMIARWAENRDAMIAALPRGVEHHYHKEPEERRHRKQFSSVQRREWAAEKCIWCGATEKLNLDHIIPIMDGGSNKITNAQTLCHPCNLWKSNFVDKVRYIAGLGEKGGQT